MPPKSKKEQDPNYSYPYVKMDNITEYSYFNNSLAKTL